MDKFVKQYQKQLQRNPNAPNHLSNPNTIERLKKSKISNYFTIQSNHNISNTISIDSSDDENMDNDDDDIQILNDRNEDINLLLNRRQNQNKTKKKQKSLEAFLKPSNEINLKTIENEKHKQNEINKYLFVEPLFNERHLFELTELCGLINNGSSQRLKQLYFGRNINCDILYRRHLHLIINNNNFHRLPIKHSLNNNCNHLNNYISNIKFDKLGSLFAIASTNGTIQIIDFDNFISKWNTKIRMKYNNDIIKLKTEILNNSDSVENNNSDTEIISDINTELRMKNNASLSNVCPIEINTGFKIEDIEWNMNQNDIAVCGHSGGSLNIYDLRRYNNIPVYKLKAESQPLLCNKYSNINNKIIISGNRMGNVFYWDLRKNNQFIPTLKFNPITNNSINFNSFINGNGNRNRNKNINLSNFAVKHLYFSGINDNILYIIRENGFIQIIDIRKNGYEYKNIDLWRSKLISNNCNKIDGNNNNKFYNNNINITHRARIDDGIILESMNSAILKLQNNSLVNIHLESEIINKTYSFQNQKNNQNELINVSFLSNVNQRRMCNLHDYNMPQIIMTGTFNNECVCIDMSSEFDIYKFEKEYKEKRVNLGLDMNENKSLVVNRENNQNELYNNKSYGLMCNAKLMNIMTCCSLHPKLLYTVCGTLDNSVEIVACASNPF